MTTAKLNTNRGRVADFGAKIRAYRKKMLDELRETLPARMAEAGCRRLEGEELAARKAELEARENRLLSARRRMVPEPW